MNLEKILENKGYTIIDTNHYCVWKQAYLDNGTTFQGRSIDNMRCDE